MRVPAAFLVFATAWGCSTTRPASRPPASPPASPTPPPVVSQDAETPLAPLDDPELSDADRLYALRSAQDPRDLRALMARAMIRQKAGDTTGATRLYRRVLELDRSVGPAYSNLGALLMESGDHRAAVDVLFEGAARSPDHAPIFANLAGALSQLDRHEEAVSAAETAIELDAEDADLRRNHVAILYRAKRYADAERALKRALAEFPDDTVDFLMRLSELHSARGDDRAAMDTLAKVNRIAPRLPLAWLRRAALLGRHEDLDGTIAVLSEALRHNEDNDDIKAFFMAAMALRLQRDLEDGLARIEKDHADVEAYLQVARVHEISRDYHAALDVLNAGVGSNPASGLLWSHIGLVETSLEREREAVDAYRRAIALDRSLHVALNNCAYLLVTAREPALRNKDEALKLARRALELQPANASYLDTLAEVQFARGDVRNARRTITRALELQPGDDRLQAQARRFEEALSAADHRDMAGRRSP